VFLWWGRKRHAAPLKRGSEGQVAPKCSHSLHYKWVQAGCQWLMSVILATQEAETRRITIQSQPGQIVQEILSQKSSSQKWAGSVAQGWGPEFRPQYCKGKKASESTLTWGPGKCHVGAQGSCIVLLCTPHRNLNFWISPRARGCAYGWNTVYVPI
jgi:hypothetical protein